MASCWWSQHWMLVKKTVIKFQEDVFKQHQFLP